MDGSFGKQTLFATVLLTIDKSVSWSLEYYLITYISSTGKELYGIKIDKLDSNYCVIDSSETFSIADSCEKALAILSYLANGLVRPIELLAMVDDWFSGEEWRGTSITPPTGQTSHTEV